MVIVSFLSWRARRRACIAVDLAESMVDEGQAMIRYENGLLRKRILKRAARRATKLIPHQIAVTNLMVGQVGGLSTHKRPVLTLKPNYVLKPLQIDHRGIREIGFYEAVKAATQDTSDQVYSYGALGANRQSVAMNCVDVLAFFLALCWRDPYVVNCQRQIVRLRKQIGHETKLLYRLQRFLPDYFGITTHQSSLSPCDPNDSLASPFGISLDSYLLLQDTTAQFSKPCVIDLKVGTQTYEPSAPKEKKQREKKKYRSQADFGFRIVGMRIYDPAHADACDKGFVFYSKDFGRSLSTYGRLKDAFLTYFGAGGDQRRSRAISSILSQLRAIQHWFDDNNSICFYSSSILIAYEGNTGNLSNPDMVSVKMIDFGRVRREAGGDPGYLLGLDTIIRLLKDIAMEREIPFT